MMTSLLALLESLRSAFGSATLNISGKAEYAKEFKRGDWFVLAALGVAVALFLFHTL